MDHIQNSDEFDSEEIRRIQAEIEFARSEKEKRIKEHEAEAEALREMKREMAIVEARLKEMNMKYNAHLTAGYDEQRIQKEIDRKIRDKERELEIARKNASIAQEVARAASKFDFIANNAFWNKDAKSYQLSGAKRLAVAGSGILADKMGLGKTFSSLIWADLVEARKILIIAPNDVVENFKEEVKIWAPHRKNVRHIKGQTKAQRNLVIEMAGELDDFVMLVNYEAWRKDFSLIERLADLQFDALILDEAHNLKNRQTAAFRGVKKLAFTENQCQNCKAKVFDVDAYNACRNCGHKAQKLGENCSIKHLLNLTGTPILNRPQDLFSLLHLVDRSNFPDENIFLNRYCTQDWDGKWIFRTGGLESLTKRIAAYYVSRNAKQVGEAIPEPTVHYYEIEVDPEIYPEQYRVMQDINQHAMIQLSEEKVVGIFHLLAIITRKRQAVSWPAGIKIKDSQGNVLEQVEVRQSAKLDRVITKDADGEWEGLIPEIAELGLRELDNDKRFAGERIVVFSQFREVLEELEKRCADAGISAVRFDGSTDQLTKHEIRKDFDRRYCDDADYSQKWQILLANYKTGGVGLNLNGATHTIITDSEWNPGKESQALGRTSRLGQTEETTVHILECVSSVDTWMRALIEQKGNMIGGFETDIDLATKMREAIENGDF